MLWLLMLTATLAAGAASGPGSRLETILDTLGKESARQRSQACRYVEHTALDELDDQGAVKGRIVREYVVTHDGSGTRRELRSEHIEGDLSSVFKKVPKNDDEPQPGPFDPSERAHYRYELEASQDGSAATLRFAPLQPNKRRMRGTATLDPKSGHLAELTLEPSKYPMLLDLFRMKIAMGETACGPEPVRVQAEGRGGFLFMKVRFRSVTTFRDHAVPK